LCLLLVVQILARLAGAGLAVLPEERLQLVQQVRLRPEVRERLPEAVRLAAVQLAAWGFPGTPRLPGAPVEPLNADSLALEVYESGRPSMADARRDGDARLLAPLVQGND